MMRRFSNWAAWIAVIAIGALAVLNLETLSTPASIDLVLGRVEAPLGLVMLGLVGVLAAVFLVATLHNQIGSLMENRRLLKEIQRVQALADQAEASRMDHLQQLIASEFRALNNRLNQAMPARERELPVVEHPLAAPQAR
jgi:uncharacterized integral membrane protein